MKHLIPLALLAAFVTSMVGCAFPVVQQAQPQKKDSAVRTEKYGYVDRQGATMNPRKRYRNSTPPKTLYSREASSLPPRFTEACMRSPHSPPG